MLRTRVIPCLLLEDQALVKTIKFRNPTYIGDPANTVRIFNELEVDELVILDILATRKKREPNFELLKILANECFMPLSYGGGISSLKQVEEILRIGFEKIIINSAAFSSPSLVTDIASHFGSQAIIVAIDVKKNIFGKYTVYNHSAPAKKNINPIEWACEMEQRGAGEILLTSINREGTWKGFDTILTQQITKAVSIPVIAHGGANSIESVAKVVKYSGASAVALGSMVVYQKKGMGVLINFPEKKHLHDLLQ